ncbi:MAG: hypothetical protein IKM33_00060 [Clostridia bacterium]|nr:hypothetical protein [Clostridia bacterium]
MMKKLLCVLLAALMLVCTLASCANGPNGPVTSETTTAAGTGPADTGEVESEATLNVPDTRYEDEELCFLTRDEGLWSTVEIFAENQTANSDNINNAVFERNDRIYQNYGVIVTELKKVTHSEHNTTVSKEVSAPSGDFQAIITNTVNSASYATSGYLWNLYSEEIEYLNVNNPWWDVNMAQGMSIDDKLYFATGDLLTADNDATFVIFFNKEIAEEKNVPDLYSLVSNKEWTMDKFYEFEVQVTEQSADGKLAYNEGTYGFAYTVDSPSCMLFSGGVTMCTKDEDDIPVYALNVDLAQNIVDKGKLLFSSDVAVDITAPSDGTDIVTAGQKAFGESHALFFGEVMQSVTRLRGYEADFGILPYPMYSAQQGNYYSMMHMTASVVSIPRSVNADDVVMVNSMIEAMAYHAVDTLTKQYYDINLKTRDARDEQSGPMIDMILANRVCDLSYYYAWGGGAFQQMAACLLPTGSSSIASMARRFGSQIERNITQLLRSMDKND